MAFFPKAIRLLYSTIFTILHIMVNLKAAFALVNKLKAIYEKNDQFLALSLGLSIDKKDFELIKAINPESEQEADQARYNFAKIVNAVPEKNMAYSTTDQMLWDVFLDLLDPAQTEVATDRVLPEALRARFEDAKRLVYTDYNTRTESALRIAFRGYKQVFEELETKIRMGDFDAQHGIINPERWTGIERPELVKNRDETLNDWKSKGAKDSIEAALQTIEAVESQTPLSTWTKWKNKTLNIQAMTAIEDAGNYYMTNFSPNDFTSNNGCWTKFTINAAMIEAAGATAPPELANLLAVSGNQSELEIESITFEIAVLSIDRPWLSEEIFQSDIWRFYQKNRLLSDGKTKPTGELPAYCTKIILAKNPVIKIKSGPGTPLNKKWLDILRTRPIWLGPLKINQLRVEIDPKTITTIDKSVQKMTSDKGLSGMTKVNPALLDMQAKTNYTRKDFGINKAKTQQINVPIIKANDFTAKNEQTKKYQSSQINWSSLVFTNFNTVNLGNVSTVNTGTVKPHTSTVLANTTVLNTGMNTSTWTSSVLTGNLGGIKRGPESGTTEEEYQILGFICKALPKSPSPNPKLVWATE
jgi:hypothetical protein